LLAKFSRAVTLFGEFRAEIIWYSTAVLPLPRCFTTALLFYHCPAVLPLPTKWLVTLLLLLLLFYGVVVILVLFLGDRETVVVGGNWSNKN